MDSIRNIFQELRQTNVLEWKLFQKFGQTTTNPTYSHPDADLRRIQETFRDPHLERSQTQEFKLHYTDTYSGFRESDLSKNEDFEFYKPIDPSSIPASRLPAPGISVLPIRTHAEQVITATEQVPETGYQLHPLLRHLIVSKYPLYMQHATKLCRPLGTTDATFDDFNREQKQYPPIEPELALRIVRIIIHLLYALPFLPLHYIDTFFCKMPLHTGTSYFYRHSYELRTHVAFSAPSEYENKQTSKGYFFNAFTSWARTVAHRIKEFGYPFDPTQLTPSEITDKLRSFFMEHATMLFTRNHISDRDGALKQRPVYAMDTLFLHLEAMITFPLHVLARSSRSAIMYSMETIRGGCARMDALASSCQSYLCIDWSSFDQRMPWIIVDLFFTLFLPLLLIISHGYQPTAEYSEYLGLTPDKMFSRLFNIISFLRLWYYNCVFVTADGYAYVRRFAGIASGMLNTQYLDSFCNLFLMIHALLHFGCTNEEILDFIYFVMGDDNVILTQWTIDRLFSFLTFFESHSLSRFGMVISTKKSVITSLRSRIEMLGYQCNCATPKRPISKLVAQLCYPEHGPNDKYMSSRAVGMAWASAGYDAEFFAFCKDVHTLFTPFAAPPSEQTTQTILKHLPGLFKMLDDVTEFTNPQAFPDIMTVRNRYATWQGELSPDKKWSRAHFLRRPDDTPLPFQTMFEYMSEHGITFPEPQQLF
uniref:RNA-dependent RNA polymerase n=1 Tax=Sclerotinia sclerotiorum partitivirus 1 TaxID=1232468 RepID=J9UVL6_9VIRU|nr:RNA-dependent RNA polymerase [Sclerotinia sclerotiorum partitivirus 1]